MTNIRYVRRRHRSGHETYEYTRASRDDLVNVAHGAYLLLIILVVFGVAALFGFWSPA